MIRRLFLLIALLPCALTAKDFPLVDQGSVWKYIDDGSDPGIAWIAPAFDDSTWKSGLSKLGFQEFDEARVIQRGATSYYFRHSFEVDEETLANLIELDLDLLRDDGAVVYLNGVELHRDNMPAGPILPDTLASRSVGGDDEGKFFRSPHLSNLLVAGANVLAVEVHQSSPGSSDLSFDLALRGRDRELPQGRSRPPCTVDFEQGEFALLEPRQYGLQQAQHPGFFGLDFSHDANGFLTDFDLLTHSQLPSIVLAAVDSDLKFKTGKIDLRNYKNLGLSLDLASMTREGSTVDSRISVSLLVHSGPGTVDDINWFTLDDYNGELTTIRTSLAHLPPDTRSIAVRIHLENNGTDCGYYFDNIQVTGDPIAADSFSTAAQLDSWASLETPDRDDDGIDQLSEYAFGGSFRAIDDPKSLMPKVSYDDLGFMLVEFRMLNGVRLGDAERGFDVADLRYPPSSPQI